MIGIEKIGWLAWREKIKYGRHLVHCTRCEWLAVITSGDQESEAWFVMADSLWAILVERVQCFVCDFVTWFGPLSVFICYWHSMRAYTLCTNWGTFFVHLSKIIFKEENGSCEIIGCYVYLLLVFRKSSAILMGYNIIAQEQTSADICTLIFVIYMHQE